MGEDSCVHPVIDESFFLFLMTFPLEFDLLMIGICTFIQGKKKNNNNKKTTKKTTKKQQKKQQKNNKKTKKKQKKQKKKTKKQKKKKKSAKTCLCLISYSIGFLLLGSSLGVWVRFL